MKLVGLLLLALAAGLVGWFGLREPLGAVVFRLDPPLLNTVQAGVQRNLSPELWNLVFLPVLTWPSWVIPAALGLLLVVLAPGRRRAEG